MPFYEYQCDSCNMRFEIQQSMFDEPRAVCPVCGKSARRIFSASTVIFKGSGFYCTDTSAAKNPVKSSECPAKSENTKVDTPAAPSCPCAACS